MDLDNGFFIVELNSYKDYLNALMGGPWVILGHYLTMQSWNPSFNVVETNVSHMVAWVRFLGMPIEYYNKSVLCVMFEVVGKFMKVD